MTNTDNFRVIVTTKADENTVNIHEVYFDKNNKPTSYNPDPFTPNGEEEVKIYQFTFANHKNWYYGGSLFPEVYWKREFASNLSESDIVLLMKSLGYSFKGKGKLKTKDEQLFFVNRSNDQERLFIARHVFDNIADLCSILMLHTRGEANKPKN